jgi:hypothetical protein
VQAAVRAVQDDLGRFLEDVRTVLVLETVENTRLEQPVALMMNAAMVQRENPRRNLGDDHALR